MTHLTHLFGPLAAALCITLTGCASAAIDQNFAEVEQPWNEGTAVRQAKRCLRCDYGKQPCECENA